MTETKDVEPLGEEEQQPKTRLSLSVMDAESLAPLFFTVLFLGVIFALFYVLSSFLADAVISFILLGLFARPYRFLVSRFRGNRWLASGVMTTAIVTLLLMPVGGFLYALSVEASRAFESVAFLFADGGETLVQNSLDFIERSGVRLTRQTVSGYVSQVAQAANALVVAVGSALFGNVLSLTVHAAVVVVMLFYLFADGERLRDFAFRLSPLPDEEDALLVETFQKVSKGVVVGNGLGSALQGALGGLAMWMVDLPSPLLWGAVMTVFAFLPLIGISIVVIPATAVLLFRAEYTMALVFFGFCLVMATFVDNVVKTKLMGSAMRMHDLLVFLSIVGGLSAFGVIGFIYGPLIAMLFITLHGLYETHYLPHFAMSLGPRSRRTPPPFSDP